MGTTKTSNGTPVEQGLVELIRRAEDARASDIHLSRAAGEVTVAWRVDGRLREMEKVEGEFGERLCGRIKFLARLKTYQETLPQDGRIDHGDLGTRHDLRVSTYPTISGEKIVLRLFNRSIAQSLTELQLPGEAVKSLQSFLRADAGLLLLTGPAGSGKTTTIYSCLRHLTELGGRHIITIEDPVEQVLPEIMQTEINEPRGLTFAVAARHLLRQDPQTLVIGEIRDEETAKVAVNGALTGHQVISTLHAGSCRGVYDRLLSLAADEYAIMASLRLILNQRLVRVFCSECSGKGCEACLGTGYRGRFPIVEWFGLDETLRTRLKAEGSRIIDPNPTMVQVAEGLVREGKTGREEVERILGA